VLVDEGDQVLLGDAKLAAEVVDMEFTALNPPSDRLGRHLEFVGDLVDGEEAWETRRGAGHGALPGISAVSTPDRRASMAAWRPSKRANASRASSEAPSA
jgi:hypothetical protein